MDHGGANAPAQWADPGKAQSGGAESGKAEEQKSEAGKADEGHAGHHGGMSGMGQGGGQSGGSAGVVREREAVKRYLDQLESADGERDEVVIDPSAVAAALEKLQQIRSRKHG